MVQNYGDQLSLVVCPVTWVHTSQVVSRITEPSTISQTSKCTNLFHLFKCLVNYFLPVGLVKYTPGFVAGNMGQRVLLAPTCFAHNHKILVVVSPDFCSDKTTRWRNMLDKITSKTPMIQYMVKFWLFCRDVGMISENPTFAQLFPKDPPGFSGEHEILDPFVPSSFQPLSSTIKSWVFGLPFCASQNLGGQTERPGKTGWTYPNGGWLFVHCDASPIGIDRTKKKHPLKNKHKYLDEKGWSCPPPKLEQHLKIIRNKSTHRPCDLEDSGSSKKSSPIFCSEKEHRTKLPPIWHPSHDAWKNIIPNFGCFQKKKCVHPTMRSATAPAMGGEFGGKNLPPGGNAE